jgi:hypothetical protein
MIEIEFRGQRTEDNDWVYGNLLQDVAQGKSYIVYKETGTFHRIIPETVCQYINKNDRDNNKIYNSDYIKANLGEFEAVCDIHWSYDCCGWLATVYNDPNAMYEVSIYELTDIEIIGNEYDNPNLLETL